MKILELKRIWGSLFGNNVNILPPLSFSELQLLMSYSENLVNKIPYGYSSICPHDLTGGDLVMPLELEADIKQGNLKGLATSVKKVREYRQILL